MEDPLTRTSSSWQKPHPVWQWWSSTPMIQPITTQSCPSNHALDLFSSPFLFVMISHWIFIFSTCFTHLFLIVSWLIISSLFHCFILDWCCALKATLVNTQHSFHQLHTACRQYNSLVTVSQCTAFPLPLLFKPLEQPSYTSVCS